MSEGQKIGEVTHYYKKPGVGIIQLRADVKLGDQLHFKGAYTDFIQRVDSMQIDHVAIESAEAKAEVAIRVDQRVRHGDSVFRITV